MGMVDKPTQFPPDAGENHYAVSRYLRATTRGSRRKGSSPDLHIGVTNQLGVRDGLRNWLAATA